MPDSPNTNSRCFSPCKASIHMDNKRDADLFGDSETNGTVQQIVSGPEDEGLRLDVYLSGKIGLTRSFIQALIKQGNISLPSRTKIKPSIRIRSGEEITIIIPPAENLEVIPEPVAFDVLYEDNYLLVINKPAGVVVHPAPGNWHGTLVHGLLYKYPEIGVFNNVVRPGIVHRLDQTTSGLMIIARNQSAMEALQCQFRERSVTKTYIALTKGLPDHKEAMIDLPLGRDPRNRKKISVISSGRQSKTIYKVLWSHKEHALMQCTLLTGRTHQIRVHLKYIGCPLVGDVLYGGKNIKFQEMGRVFLHSWKLGFRHPKTGKQMSFCQPLPSELIFCLQCILSRDQA